MNDTPAPTYGVWIRGQGWLKDSQRRVFADLRLEYAECAARHYGQGAQVRYIDDSMIAMEAIFLEREKRAFSYRLRSWINGLLDRHSKPGK